MRRNRDFGIKQNNGPLMTDHLRVSFSKCFFTYCFIIYSIVITQALTVQYIFI